MKKAFLILLAALATSLFAQPHQDSLTARLDGYFSALAALNTFNGNVLVSHGDGFCFDRTYNMQLGHDSLAVNRDSRFIMASVSKVFVKLAILKLVELERVSLSDKLDKYIPDFPNGTKITLQHLMDHRSGLPRELTHYERRDAISLQETVELAKAETLQFEPGSQYLYSNVGYFLLHHVIDIASPKGYHQFVSARILKKMKLRNTGEYNTAGRIRHFAQGYDVEDGMLVPASQSSISRFETGNYYTTMGDLHSFSRQLLDGRVVRRDLALQMFGQDSILLQAGGRPGYRAFYYQSLRSGITFLMLSNCTEMPFQQVTEDVLKIMQGTL
jgi:CubicO group peptidase (beta-lactamase class C family)